MLAEIEDAMITRCQKVVGEHVKTIEDLPGNWDEATLKAARRKVPGIYIAWSGGPAVPASRATINGRYAVYIVTGQASVSAPGAGAPTARWVHTNSWNA